MIYKKLSVNERINLRSWFFPSDERFVTALESGQYGLNTPVRMPFCTGYSVLSTIWKDVIIGYRDFF